VDVALDLAAEFLRSHVGIAVVDSGPDPRLEVLVRHGREPSEEALLARQCRVGWETAARAVLHRLAVALGSGRPVAALISRCAPGVHAPSIRGTSNAADPRNQADAAWLRGSRCAWQESNLRNVPCILSSRG
jgi:hypothetical protein